MTVSPSASDLWTTGEGGLDSGEEDGDTAEYVVPVTWIKTLALEDAFWRQGLFATQNSACKLRNQFTIDEVSKLFGLDDVVVADLG